MLKLLVYLLQQISVQAYAGLFSVVRDFITLKDKLMKIINTLLVAILVTACSQKDVSIQKTSPAIADKIIVNAKAWTGNKEQPWTETIVINDSRIIAVGDSSLVAQYQAKKIIDAQGKLVLPGFIDNHTHFIDGANSLVSVGTYGSKTSEEFLTTIKNFAATAPKDEWITGGLWDHEAWGGELPHKSWLDDISTEIPIYLMRTDGHMAIVNSKVLALAGINKDTPNPEGGLIEKDANGEPTGIIKDNALSLIRKMLPPATDEKNARTFDVGVQEALKNGVTQIHEMSENAESWSNIAIFEKAKAEGRLKIRTYFLPHISMRHDLAEKIKKEGKGDAWLRFGGVKELVDGSLGSTTAWFYEPYTDAPETSGFALMQMEDLKQNIKEAHELGLQLAIHGIGDKTNDEILKIFDELNVKGSRPRIEHAQHLSRGAINRFAELEVIPSMHPYHAIDDGRWAEGRIGAERIKTTYAFKSLLDAGATLSFGSDWYVAPLNPLAGIYAAVMRRTLDGKNPMGWVPQEKISVEDAVMAYTINNAYAGFQENELGTIEVGKLADLVILDKNIFEIAPEMIITTKVTHTIIGGEVMYKMAQ
jgi:hypothetical protein